MSKRILVIDDEIGIRKSFVLAFEDTPYEVQTAESGEKGITMAKKSKFDLVFLDLKMPGMNGVETLRELRKMDRDVPIYIITAFHQEFLNQLKKAKEDKLDFELLQKPIDSGKLVAIVRAIFEGSARY